MAKRAMIILIFSFLLILSYLFPHKFWAFSAITIYPLWFQLVVWILILLLFFNKTVFYIDDLIDKISNLIYVKKDKKYLLMLFFAIFVMLLISWNDHCLLGNTEECVEAVRNFPQKITTNIRRLPNVVTFKLFCMMSSKILSCWRTISILHIILGLIYFLISFKFSDNIFKNHKDKLLSLMFLTFSGGTLVFSHIEYYAIPLIFNLLTIYLLHKAAYQKVNHFYALIPALLAFVYNPLLIYLVFSVIISMMENKKKYIVNLTTVASTIAILFIALYNPISGIKKYFLTQHYPIYFYSIHHIIMVINYILFLSPITLFLVYYKKDLKVKNRYYRLLRWMSIISILLLLVLNLELGGADWDLAVTISFPLLVYSILKISLVFDRETKNTLLYLTIIIFLYNALVGISDDLEVKRAEQLLVNQKIPRIEKEFPGIERLAFFSRIMYTKYGKVNYKKYAIKYSKESIRKYPTDERGYLFLSGIYEFDGDYESAIKVLNDAINRARNSYRAMEKLSNIYQKLGKKKKAIELLMNAPEVPESTALSIERPDERTLGEMILLIKQALNEMTSGGKAAVFKSKSGYYFSVRRGNAKVYIEIVPVKKTIMLYIHSALVQIPKSSKKLFLIENFLMDKNNILKTGPAKFYIWGDKLCVGVARPLKNLDKYEIKYFINEVSKLADAYNDLLAKKFGCKLIMHK